MSFIKLICYECKNDLEIGFEYKEGARKEWLVKPCSTCLHRAAELPRADGTTVESMLTSKTDENDRPKACPELFHVWQIDETENEICPECNQRLF